MRNIERYLFILLVVIVMGTGCKSQPAVSSEKVRDIFAGAAGVFVLRQDNTLWAAGYNRSGQLGLGEFTDKNAAQTAASLEEVSLGGVSRGIPVITCITDDTGAPFLGVTAVAAGENHTVILKDDGTLWGAGGSSYGELGQGDGNFPVFTQLKADGGALSGVLAAAAGNNSTFFIAGDGSLWAAGYNYYGELGLGNRDTQTSFVKAESAGPNVKALAAGMRHTALLKEDGTLWTSGYNFNGQLGLGGTDDRNSFTEVTSAGSGITAVAAGNYHTVILKSDGSVWTAGSNNCGQLGFSGQGGLSSFTRALDENGSPLSGVTEIAARGNITVLLRADGSLLLAGDYTNPDGIQEPDLAALFAGGENPEKAIDTAQSSFVPLLPEEGAPADFGAVKKIVLGYNSIYVITSDGSLWAAGSNRYGQLSLDFETEALAALKLINP